MKEPQEISKSDAQNSKEPQKISQENAQKLMDKYFFTHIEECNLNKALQLLVFYKEIYLIKPLLEYEDENGATILHWLAYYQKQYNKEVVDIFKKIYSLTTSINLEQQNNNGNSPQSIVKSLGKPNFFTDLIQQIETLNPNLINAASKGFEKDVKELLDKGADVNFIMEGKTALQHAIENGHVNIVKLLLPNSNTEQINSGLMYVAEKIGGSKEGEEESKSKKAPSFKVFLELIDLLLEPYLNKKYPIKDLLNYRDQHNNTIFHLFAAVKTEYQNEIVDRLIKLIRLKSDIDFSQLNESKKSSYDCAKNANNLFIYDLLKKASTRNINLLAAAQNGSLKQVKQLVDDGADVNFKIGNDQTALFLAAQNGHQDIVDFLEPKDASTDKIPKLLEIAVSTGNEKLLEYLLKSYQLEKKMLETAMTQLLKFPSKNQQKMIDMIKKELLTRDRPKRSNSFDNHPNSKLISQLGINNKHFSAPPAEKGTSGPVSNNPSSSDGFEKPSSVMPGK